MRHVPRHVPSPAVATIVALLLGACARGDRAPDSASAARASSSVVRAAGAARTDSTPAGGGMAMAGGTGDPDHDFLRMMSDHHKGLIAMAHMTMERKQGTAVADARTLDAKQDAELDSMVTMLEHGFKDPYTPSAMPEHAAMAKDLRPRAGTDYDRTFYRDVVTHHQEALKMIDDYLPNARNAAVKSMAERMKRDQTREIADLETRIAKLGP